MKLCPEVKKYAEQMQHQIDCNTHLDNGEIRGWKSKPTDVLLDVLKDELRDLLRAIEQVKNPIGGQSENTPSVAFIAKQAADVGCAAMMASDSCGGIE